MARGVMALCRENRCQNLLNKVVPQVSTCPCIGIGVFLLSFWQRDPFQEFIVKEKEKENGKKIIRGNGFHKLF